MQEHRAIPPSSVGIYQMFNLLLKNYRSYLWDLVCLTRQMITNTSLALNMSQTMRRYLALRRQDTKEPLQYTLLSGGRQSEAALIQLGFQHGTFCKQGDKRKSSGHQHLRLREGGTGEAWGLPGQQNHGRRYRHGGCVS